MESHPPACLKQDHAESGNPFSPCNPCLFTAMSLPFLYTEKHGGLLHENRPTKEPGGRPQSVSYRIICFKTGLACVCFYNECMRCPICKEPLVLENKSFVCANRHSFDKARQGYVNLSRKQKAGGDNKEMVQARTAFLEKDYYDFLRDAIREKIGQEKPQVLADLGCGQGWYTKTFAPLANTCYGIDLSKDAIAHAAAHDKSTQYIVGSIYDLPFEDESIDTLVSIFTPLPVKEALRVLRPGGHFLVASPGADHHQELKEVLYQIVRKNDPPEEIEGMELVQRVELRQKKHVYNPMELLEMTPYFWKSPKEGVERLKAKAIEGGLDVTFDFLLSDWKKPESTRPLTNNPPNTGSQETT